eukprot:TRINITY_DN10546_c0_g1_i2.p1 TRINITY_DN10546_c0_g1~~TRINITY_DN10546_c0_g1_i2.p1  ORF type:complete len:153 (+),score=2.95 TRINITY_DN10546_c0_g1_i2:223-681(+)
MSRDDSLKFVLRLVKLRSRACHNSPVRSAYPVRLLSFERRPFFRRVLLDALAEDKAVNVPEQAFGEDLTLDSNASVTRVTKRFARPTWMFAVSIKPQARPKTVIYDAGVAAKNNDNWGHDDAFQLGGTCVIDSLPFEKERMTETRCEDGRHQ